MNVLSYKEYKKEYNNNYNKDIVKDISIIDRFLNESVDNDMIESVRLLKNKLLSNKVITDKDIETYIQLNYILYLYSYKQWYVRSMDSIVYDSYEFYLTVLCA